MKSRYVLMAEMFKALGDENRLKLLEELKDGEKNAGELLEKLSVTQPTLSHHMKILCDSGIVDSRKDGKWTYYKISEEGIGELLDIINSFAVKGKYKSSFKIEDIVVSKAVEEKPEKKAEKKKPAKKTVKKETVKEVLTVPVEEEKEEKTEVVEKTKEETKNTEEEPKKEESGNYTMPSWLF